MNRNFYLSVIILTVLAFLGGWLIWGIMLMDFYSVHTSEAAKPAMRAEDSMIMWAIIASNLLWAIVITWILGKTGDRTFASGFKTSFILALLVMLAFNLGMYAFADVMDMTLIVVDSLVSSLFWGLLGGVAGWMLGRGTPAAA
jgi:hypothetical protein